MSPPARATAGWTLVGLSLVLTWAALRRVPSMHGITHPRGLAEWVDLSFLASPIGAGLATIAFLAAVVALVLDRHRALAAAVIAALLALGTHIAECQWAEDIGVAHGTAMPGAAIAAYAIAWCAARTRTHEGSRSVAIEASCGVVAASYVLAGAAKLSGSGLAWADGTNLALHIASHAYLGAEWLQPLRLALAGQLGLCSVLGAATLIVECSFALFVLRRARPALALLALGMHVSISVLMGLHHYEWLCMTAGLTLVSTATLRDEPAARPPS